MNNQVLSISQMQELIELGIDTSKAHLWWYSDEKTMPIVVSTKCNFSNSTYIPTFTLQDVLSLIGIYQLTHNIDNCSIDVLYGGGHHIIDNTELEAAFDMLKWCKENNEI